MYIIYSTEYVYILLLTALVIIYNLKFIYNTYFIYVSLYR